MALTPGVEIVSDGTPQGTHVFHLGHEIRGIKRIEIVADPRERRVVATLTVDAKFHGQVKALLADQNG